jgi:hypothetical protein
MISHAEDFNESREKKTFVVLNLNDDGFTLIGKPIDKWNPANLSQLLNTFSFYRRFFGNGQ